MKVVAPKKDRNNALATIELFLFDRMCSPSLSLTLLPAIYSPYSQISASPVRADYIKQ